jgi:ribA/ribD-fused uncharacterized protein
VNKPITKFAGPYRFLSNFWRVSVHFRGVTYQTSEHAYQASKALHPEDAARIAECPYPHAAKRLARIVEKRPDWEADKVIVMHEILRAKFTQNKELAQRLLSTGCCTLVEGNKWHDTFWGVCDGEGQNVLGRLLMGIREELRSESSIR